MEILPVIIDVIQELPEETRGLFAYAIICDNQGTSTSDEFDALLEENQFANAVWDLIVWINNHFRNSEY